MIDGGEFLLETMHRRNYPNHPLWKHAVAVVKARGENQYIVTEYIFNSWIFSLKYYLLLFHTGKIYVVILFDEMKVYA